MDDMDKTIVVRRGAITPNKIDVVDKIPAPKKLDEVVPITIEDRVIKYLDNITSKFRDDDEVVDDVTQVGSLIVSLGSMNDLDKDAMCRALSIIMGKKISPMTRKFSKHCVVVPVGNPNGHNYPLGVPVVLQNDSWPGSVAIKATGKNGDTMDLRTARAATLEEIKKFVQEITVDKLCPALGIVVI